MALLLSSIKTVQSDSAKVMQGSLSGWWELIGWSCNSNLCGLEAACCLLVIGQ
jgi:hypothetical protein